ncbi:MULTISPECIES: hypothetical protein [unclassified Streptomyces]|uniref:hypothetical protein n=1 Tax=unclassified Streptomyces TaxID=2593676 RepID=UPI00211A080C|nr:hypothetical protein [Streptomyces sp. 13-12-16]
MSTTESTAETTEKDAPAGEPTDKRRGGDRAGLLTAGAILVACLGFVLYGVLGTEDDPRPERPKTPTAAVTYRVTGEGSVDVSYLARGEEGRATVEKDVELPWEKTVQVPLGQPPTLGIVLDGKGGQARCALAVRGAHVQSATASGTYGRATCAAERLAAPEGAREGS